MDAQAVNFAQAEKAVEGFITALQELKAMMKSINDLPITRLKGVEQTLVNPMQEAVKKLADSGGALVEQFKQIGTKSGEALGSSSKASITKATQQAKQAMKGHYDALGVYVAEGSAELKKAADLANARALMLDTGVVRQATQQAKQAMKGHYDALGVYVAEGSAELKKAADLAHARALMLDTGVVRQATQQAKQTMKGHYDALGVYVAEGSADLVSKAKANQEALARVYAKFGQLATPDTGIRLQAGAQAGLTELKGYYAELSRVADLKAQIKRRLEASDVAFKPAASPRMSLDQRDAQYNESMAALRAHYAPLDAGVKVSAGAQAAVGIKQQTAATRELGEAHAKAAPHLAKTVTNLNDMHSAARGVASGFNAMWLTWGALVPLLAGAAVSNAFVQTVKQGAALNDTFERLRVLGGESAQAVAGLNAQMLELARSGPVAPQEIAEAMKTLRLAGLDAAEVAASIKDVLNFSIAGDTSLTQAAEAITTIGTAFNIAAADYSYISDTVAKAAAESKASIESMSEAMKTASVVHQQYGVSLEDTAVGLSLLANAGIQGSAAGTALRNMYVDLAGRTEKVSAKLKQLGVEALDPLTGKMRSQAEIFKQLISGLQKYETAAGATKALQEIFSERSAKQAIALYNAMTSAAKKSGTDIATAYDDLLEKVTNAGGTAALAAAELALTPLRQMESVKSTLQSTLVEVFNSLQPYILQLATDLKTLFNSAEFKGTLQELVTGVGELTKFLFEHGKAIAYVVIGYQGLKAVASLLTAVGTAYSVMSGQVAAGTAAMGLAARAATVANPLMLALAAAVSAAASAWALYTMWAGKGTEATAPAAQDRDALLKNLEAEHKRLREINAAREKGIDLADYLATKQAKAVVSTDSAEVAKARAALKDAESFAASRIKGTGASVAAQRQINDAQAALTRALEVQAAKDKAIASLQAGIRDFGNTTGRTERYKAEDEALSRAALFKGSGLPDVDDKKGARDRITSLSLQHGDELRLIEKRYHDEVSTIKAAEQNAQNLLKASHDAKLINSGEFYARELGLAAEAEAKLLAQAQSSASAAMKAVDAGRETVSTRFQRWVEENQNKDGFAERYLTEWEKVSTELTKLGNEYDNLSSKLANDQGTIKDNAVTRMELQAIKAAGQVAALAKETEDFWKAESDARAAAQRAADVEDLLRYATPEAAAYISASTQEQERLNKVMLENDKAVQLAEASLLSYAAALEWEWQITEAQTEQLALMAKALEEVKKRRDELSGKAGGMASDAGNAAVAKLQKDETARFIKGISGSVATALFEGGKAGRQKLRDLVVAKLREPITLMIDAIVNPVMGALMGSLGFSGAATAGQGSSGSGGLGTLKSAYDALNNGVSNAVTSGFEKLVNNGVGEKLGLSYYNGTGYETTGIGQSVGQYAGMAGNALAGYGLQKAISGGYKTGESGIVDAITVAASAYFGPIAGIAAGVFNRAFGRKLADQGLQGQFGGEAGFTGENFQFYKGGWFRSDKTKTSALDPAMQSSLADQFKAIQVQTALMATVLGDTGQGVADFTTSIKLSFNGLTEAQIGEKLAETFTGIANDMAKLVLGNSDFAKKGEDASQTLQRLSTSLTTVNGTFDVLGFSLKAVSLAGADAASDFVDLMGGLEAFTSATTGYYANFYSEAERQAKSTETLTKQLAGLGQTMPTTREGFRTLVEAAEAAGNTTLLAGLLNLQDEFAALVPSTNELKRSIEDLRNETEGLETQLLQAQGKTAELRALELAKLDPTNRALQQRIWALEDEKEAIDKALSALEKSVAAERKALEVRLEAAQELENTVRGIFDLLTDSIRDLRSEALAASSAAEGNQFIENALANARATGYLPDQDGLSNAIGAARTGLSSNNFTSASEQRLAQMRLLSNLTGLQEIAGEQLTIAEQARLHAERQIEQLDETLDYWREQISIANGTYTAVLSVAEAINNLAAKLNVPTTGTPTASFGPGTSAGFSAGPSGPQSATQYATTYDQEVANIQAYVAQGRFAYVSDLGSYGSIVTGLDSKNAPAEVARYQAIQDYVVQALAQGATAQDLANAAAENGVTQRDIATAMGYHPTDVREFFAGAGIPAFAVGTNYVPNDMLAFIHKGEAVVPKAYNPAAGGAVGGSNSDEVFALVAAHLAAIRAQNDQMLLHASATARATNEIVSQPLLVEVTT